MSESQYDYLDRVVNTHISECNGELPRLSFEKELERQRLAGECCADTIQKEIDRLAAGSVLPSYPSPRPLEEKVATTGKEIAAIIENERWGLLRKKMVSMIADAGTDDPAVMQAIENERCRQDVMDTSRRVREYMESASPPFARVPDYNNELLLLL